MFLGAVVGVCAVLNIQYFSKANTPKPEPSCVTFIEDKYGYHLTGKCPTPDGETIEFSVSLPLDNSSLTARLELDGQVQSAKLDLEKKKPECEGYTN